MPRHRSWPSTSVRITIRVDPPVLAVINHRASEWEVTRHAAARKLITAGSVGRIAQPMPWPAGTRKVIVRLLALELAALETAAELRGRDRQAMAYSLLSGAVESGIRNSGKSS